MRVIIKERRYNMNKKVEITDFVDNSLLDTIYREREDSRTAQDGVSRKNIRGQLRGGSPARGGLSEHTCAGGGGHGDASVVP